MRFLMLNWRDPENPLSGGAERVTQGYLAALARRGHEVYWFAFGYPGAASESKLDGIHIVRRGDKGTAIVHAIRWMRRQAPFDLVIDQHHGIPWYAPWWCGTQCLAYVHEVLGPIWDSFYPWPLNRIGQWQESWTHRLYRRVPFWTASSCAKRRLLGHGVRQVRLIPYGVATRAVDPLPSKRLQPPIRLATASRLAPNKRVDHAIHCLRLLNQSTPAHLTVIGGGVIEPALKRLVRSLNLESSVAFTGIVPEEEKDRLLKEAHFLLHTSQREGWGLNVIEANAMGTPAAVYPVDGLIESTLKGETGLVSAEETPESLAAEIRSVAQEPDHYERLRRAAWSRAGEYHWERVLPQACDWLEQLASHKPVPRAS